MVVVRENTGGVGGSKVEFHEREREIAREMERETRQRNRSVQEGGRCLKKNDNAESGGAGLDGE
jgi:hypothetical protein